MTSSSSAAENLKIAGMQERRLGRTVLYTRRTTVDIDDVVPNPQQPRLGPKEDVELQRQIVANQGIFEPLLVEPHPDLRDKYRIVDGDRRWTNSKCLVDAGKEAYRAIPVEITNRTLTDDERLRVWIYIHRQRKDWDAKEKEMVAYSLVQMVGRASAASILGMSVRELDKLVQTFAVAERFHDLPDPAAAITWARELMGISKQLITPEVIEVVVDKAGQKRITNSKDLRKLRRILRDPVAKSHFLSPDGDIESALLRVSQETSPKKTKQGLASDLSALTEAMKRYPWTELKELQGDKMVVEKIDEARQLLAELREMLSDA